MRLHALVLAAASGVSLVAILPADEACRRTTPMLYFSLDAISVALSFTMFNSGVQSRRAPSQQCLLWYYSSHVSRLFIYASYCPKISFLMHGSTLKPCSWF